jgi:hypothetical protein
MHHDPTNTLVIALMLTSVDQPHGADCDPHGLVDTPHLTARLRFGTGSALNNARASVIVCTGA